jgi:His-Xaa-Ser system protein HxsD
MSDPTAHFPTDLVVVDLPKGAIALTVDAGLYPLSALYAAGYIFIDRCYVLLDKPDATHFRVTLAVKKGEATEAVLSSFVGEFGNELLSCAWRAKIAEESRAIIESATAQALQGAMGPPSLDDLEKFDFSEEAFEDPLGIAMSWEEKYGKNKKKAGAGEEVEAASSPAKEQA